MSQQSVTGGVLFGKMSDLEYTDVAASGTLESGSGSISGENFGGINFAMV